MCEAAGYAELAERLGRVRRVRGDDLTVLAASDNGHDIRDSGTCIDTLERRITALETLAANLAMQLSAVQTELAGLRTNISNIERRCTCHEAQVTALEEAQEAHGR